MPAGETKRSHADPDRLIDVWSFALTAPRGRRREQARQIRATVLADYLDVSPEHVRLDLRPGGKPILADDGSLHFNLSHSEDFALLAVSRTLEVGVDLDHPRPGLNLDLALRDRCSAREAEFVRAAPDPQATFTKLWVRKEAVVKAAGVGVLDQLARIDVLGERVLADEDALPGTWVCVDLPDPAPGYFAALAYPDGARAQLRHLSLESDLRR